MFIAFADMPILGRSLPTASCCAFTRLSIPNISPIIKTNMPQRLALVFMVELPGFEPGSSPLITPLSTTVYYLYGRLLKRSMINASGSTPSDPDPHSFVEVVGNGLHDVHDDRYLKPNPVCCDQSSYDPPCDCLDQCPSMCFCQLGILPILSNVGLCDMHSTLSI